MSTTFVYKVRLYPNIEQEDLIKETFSCSRFVYNKLLENVNNNYKAKLNNKEPAYIKISDIKSEYVFLKKVDSTALCSSWQNLQDAFKAYKRRKLNPEKYKGKLGYPVFHKKGKSKDSYRTNNINNSIRIELGKLRLPKLGLINAVLHRKIKGEIKSVTVSQNSCKEYYASISTKQRKITIPKITKDPKDKNILGIDMSLSNFAVLSNKTITKFVNHYKMYENKIAKAHKSISRKKKYSNRREKAKLKLSKLSNKVSNRTKDFLHKLSFDIAKNYDVVVVEDIDLIEMSNKNKSFKLGKSVYSINFGMFREMLEYKLKNKGKEFVKADKWFPSTQLCNMCGYKNKETKDLSIRKWKCPSCHASHDRDLNAAINLENWYRSMNDIALVRCLSVADATSETLNDQGSYSEKNVGFETKANLIKTTECQLLLFNDDLSVLQASVFAPR
jgi:putative transposase